jgi:hypothetical protein
MDMGLREAGQRNVPADEAVAKCTNARPGTDMGALPPMASERQVL